MFQVQDKGKIRRVGELTIPSKYTAENQKNIERTVEYFLFGDKVPDILQFISDNKLYTEHIPISYDDSKRINTATFVLTAAAFEWNANSFLDIPKSSGREQIKQDVLESIDKLAEEKSYDSKQKGKLKFFRKRIDEIDTSLSEKIKFSLEKYNDALLLFIQNLYGLNRLDTDEINYAKISERLQNQRNAFAHGQIDRELDEMMILDIIVLEWLVYCIVLGKIGFTDVEIFNIINAVFRRNFVPKQPEDITVK